MKDLVIEKRKKKDIYFRTELASPLPIWAKKRFKGLDYYNYNDFWEIMAIYQILENSDEIEISNNFGGKELYLNYAKIEFEINSNLFSIIAFALKLNPKVLWLPFKDKTNIGDTYGAGRFLAIKQEMFIDGHIRLNFNDAYNPYCAYNEKFSCPLIPQTNFIDIAVDAGEKKPPKWL
jgi:uncharacterized protein (DUF1684 family)